MAGPTKDAHQLGAPVVMLYCTDLMFTVQLQTIARKAGLRPVGLRSATDILPETGVLVVDMAAKGDWVAVIEAARAVSVPVVVFGPHVDTESRRKARAAGAARVLANSTLARELPGIMAAIAAGNPNVDALAGESDTNSDEQEHEHDE